MKQSENQREKDLIKIRKMFALANDASASEGEIENALKFAAKLMAKHNIDETEIEISVDDIDIEMVDNSPKKDGERKYWQWDLLGVIGDSYGCTVIQSKRICHETYSLVDCYKIVGTREDREMVRALFEMTVPVIRNLKDKRYNELKDKAALNPLLAIPTKKYFTASYIHGFMAGLAIKLNENKEQIKQEDETGKYGLILVKKTDLVKEFITEKMPKLKKAASTTAKTNDGGAFIMGMEDGKENQNKKLM